MNAMLEFTNGRCTNDLFCAVASAGDVVRVPVGARFVCAYCGSKLVEQAPQDRRIRVRKGMIVGGGMGAAGVAMFAIGYLLGNPAPPPDHAAAPAAETAQTPAPMNTAPASQPDQVARQQPAAQSPEPAREAGVPTPAPSVSVVTQQPAEPPPIIAPAASQADVGPSVARPSGIQKAPAKLQTSQSAIAPPAPPLILAMAERPLVQEAKIAPPARQAQTSTTTADDAAVASAHLSALLQPPPAAAPSPPDSDSLNQAEAAKLAAPPPQKVAGVAPPAPIVAGPTRGFAPRPVQGGAPIYPAAYEGGDRTGRVTVRCRIEADGAPTGCEVVASHGGHGFDISVLNWLGGGGVRFAPILHDGQATAETHQWSVDFQPSGG